MLYLVGVSSQHTPRKIREGGAHRWVPGGRELFAWFDSYPSVYDKAPGMGLSSFRTDRTLLETIALKGHTVASVVPDARWEHLALSSRALRSSPDGGWQYGPLQLWIASYRDMQLKHLGSTETGLGPAADAMVVGWTPDGTGIVLILPYPRDDSWFSSIWLAPLNGAPWRKVVDGCDVPRLSEPWPYVL